ncbi:hypothetical protein GGX14DRAFT_563397 [Mycena pura]|uniref:Uncharacterized protein n=1 Tax=Mycena pura TaxID=153505 RepID=A0AAD6VKY3_9AGAR|nr:hypothetical protein GGX14DRAFT_563397 [Mycena pura]
MSSRAIFPFFLNHHLLATPHRPLIGSVPTMSPNGQKVDMERWEGREGRGGAVGVKSGSSRTWRSLAPSRITVAGSAGITPTSTPSPRLQHIRDNHGTPPATPTAHPCPARSTPACTPHAARCPPSTDPACIVHHALRSRKLHVRPTAPPTTNTPHATRLSLPAALCPLPVPPPPAGRHLFFTPVPATRPRAEEHPIPAAHHPRSPALLSATPARACIAPRAADARHLPPVARRPPPLDFLHAPRRTLLMPATRSPRLLTRPAPAALSPLAASCRSFPSSAARHPLLNGHRLPLPATRRPLPAPAMLAAAATCRTRPPAAVRARITAARRPQPTSLCSLPAASSCRCCRRARLASRRALPAPAIRRVPQEPPPTAGARNAQDPPLALCRATSPAATRSPPARFPLPLPTPLNAATGAGAHRTPPPATARSPCRFPVAARCPPHALKR